MSGWIHEESESSMQITASGLGNIWKIYKLKPKSISVQNWVREFESDWEMHDTVSFFLLAFDQKNEKYISIPKRWIRLLLDCSENSILKDLWWITGVRISSEIDDRGGAQAELHQNLMSGMPKNCFFFVVFTIFAATRRCEAKSPFLLCIHRNRLHSILIQIIRAGNILRNTTGALIAGKFVWFPL